MKDDGPASWINSFNDSHATAATDFAVSSAINLKSNPTQSWT